jgi:hypothetical protein
LFREPAALDHLVLLPRFAIAADVVAAAIVGSRRSDQVDHPAGHLLIVVRDPHDLGPQRLRFPWYSGPNELQLRRQFLSVHFVA